MSYKMHYLARRAKNVAWEDWPRTWKSHAIFASQFPAMDGTIVSTAMPTIVGELGNQSQAPWIGVAPRQLSRPATNVRSLPAEYPGGALLRGPPSWPPSRRPYAATRARTPAACPSLYP